MDVSALSIKDIQLGLQQKKFSDVELVKGYLDRIRKYDKDIQSFITLCEETALEKAGEVDRRIANGEELGFMAGVPVALKDNMCTNGIKTTCASKMLSDFVPPYDAGIVEKLRQGDAVILGKLNMDEFAMGSSNENSAFFKTKNPWDLERVPGGSSGGSAAAASAGFAPITYGSDTGGSIRMPASFCGLVGVKPTYGTVSRYGLIAFGSSLDQIGTFGRRTEDAAYALEAIQGFDPKDSTSLQKGYATDYATSMKSGIKGLKIGIPREFFQEGLHPEVKDSVLKAVSLLERQGALVEEFSLPITDSGLSAYYIISSAEASSNLGRYDGVRYGYRTTEFSSYEELVIKSRTEGFGDEVKRRIMLGTYVLSSGYYEAYYKKAMLFRQKVKKLYQSAFEKYDTVISPTVPVLPFKLGEKTADPLAMYLADTYTVNVNIAGIPAISVPSGFSQTGLPIGIQLMGNYRSEETLFKFAYSLEQELALDLVPKIGEVK
ncbi:MAG: Asp-tRNA(Asn)/Glu-tRNA(Gln) amidotransferase subunit GatA [Tissierellales bacterium]|nr:Asp-tRNA(Asn)/Glu-tRNA(Gln) amidotransferase subunit GatA [Tissierellales bacterium]MBN2826523.1 Asp-tRNA(Asn)/Glu-tRNA(Gln) amidotransferase subunit GatA [Tissierellales bacterium]